MNKSRCNHPGHGKYSFDEFSRLIRQNVKEMARTDDISGFEVSSSIRMLANMFDVVTNQSENEKGISDPRMGILMRLLIDEKMGIGEPSTPTGLSKTRNVSKNTISALVRGLEEQGLVTREIDEYDKRVFRLRITDKGRDLVLEDTPRKARELNSMIDILSSEEQEQLIGLLDKLRKSMIERVCMAKKGLSKTEDNGFVETSNE
jgi:DNA-binding MarR family transcriptional regulator